MPFFTSFFFKFSQVLRITFAFLFVFSTLILVLRSEAKLIRQSRIRILNCFVAIEPNFAAIGLAWLNRPPPRRNDEAGQSNASNDQAMSRRRISISTCRNLFEIDGTIEEVGSYQGDLHRVARYPRDEPSTSADTTNADDSLKSCALIDAAIANIASMPSDLTQQAENEDDIDNMVWNYDSDDSDDYLQNNIENIGLLVPVSI